MRPEPWEGYQGLRTVDKDYLRELFAYEDGELYWQHRPVSHFRNYKAWRLWRYRYAATQAGTLPNYERPRKHRRVTIDGSGCYLSRVIWTFHYGRWPSYCWHRDGDRQNCAVENLEALSLTEHLERLELISSYYALNRWSSGEWSRHLVRSKQFESGAVLV